jgi:hypothetical protein
MRRQGGTGNLGSKAATLLVASGLMAGSAVFVTAQPAFAASPFQAGDVAVYRVGTGTALTSSGTAAFIDEYSPSGTLVQSIPLPTAASGSNNPLVSGGTATSEGGLTLSQDGSHLVAAGYDQIPGKSSSIDQGGAATVALIDGNGNVDTSTTLPGFPAGNNVRSAASDSGTNIWVSGATNGVAYTTDGSSSTPTALSTGKNIMQVEVFGNQLYYSSQKSSGPQGVGTVGSGLPSSGSPTFSLLPGSPDASGTPYAFALVTLGTGSTPNTLYVADGSSSAPSILKFGLSSGTWVAEGSISVTVPSGDTLTGLAVSVSGSTATLFATAGGGGASGGGALFKTTDSTGAGGTASGSVTTPIATAASDEAFRGVALVPTASVGNGLPEAPFAVMLPLGAVLIGATVFGLTRRRRAA